MLCNVVIPLSHGDEGCHLIVTEADYIPEKRFFEIESGYVVEPGFDFTEVYNMYYHIVQRVMKAWWDEDNFKSIDWEDYPR